MCGRFTAVLAPEHLAEMFNLSDVVAMMPRYNIAPTQPVFAIWEVAGRRQGQFARWGLVPRWVKDPRDFPLVINARAETMAKKPAFRDGLKHGRCIVPASGYYEWHTGPDKKKQPYYLTRADDQPLAMAGLYASWSGPDGEEIDSVATITVAANPQVCALHDRMPAVLTGPDEIDAWLDVREIGAEAAASLARPLADGALKFYPVSTRVNSARDDDPGLIEAVTPERPAPPPAGQTGPAQMDLF